ncbi:hypothetical protein FRC11_008785, partial [Ceratobasidium sp. 423]
MAFSSVSVVGSSLLLRFWQRPVVEGVEEEKQGGIFRGIWEEVRGLGRRRGKGYEALPVEMEDRV